MTAPAIIVQENLAVKAAQTALLLLLAALSLRRRTARLLIGSLIFVTATVIMNLLSPAGRVLVRLGAFPLTQDALFVGLEKGTTVVCLLNLSRLSVRPSLSLPGRLGSYVSRTFGYLNDLFGAWKTVPRGKLVGRLDALFETVYNNRQQSTSGAPRSRTTVAGVLFVVCLPAANWALVFLPVSALLGPR